MRKVPRFELVNWVVENMATARYKMGGSEVIGDEGTLAMMDWDLVVEEATRHHGYAYESHEEVTGALPEVLGMPEGETLLTMGASEANAIVMQLLCRDGTNVVADLPAYQPLPELPGLYGARTVPVPRYMEEGWRLDLQRVQEAVSSSTVAIFTSNLHNPTGAALMREDIRALADIAADAHATLVVDEIFRPFVEDDNMVPPVRTVVPEAITTGSVSKVYSWPATRLGWISAAPETVREARNLKWLVAPTFGLPNTAMARQLVPLMPELRDRARAVARRGMAAMGEWVDSRDDVSWVPPNAGIICFPRFEGVEDTVSLARRALEEHGVMTSPGEFFGLPGHLRIGVGHPDMEHVREGLRLLGETMDTAK